MNNETQKPSGQEEVLRIEDLVVHYETVDGVAEALNGISLTLHSGEALGLVGETGAGKTTIGLSIMGLLPTPPAHIIEGKVFFKGRDMDEMSKGELRSIRGKDISMVFQDAMASLNPTMTVGAQMIETIRAHRNIGKSEAAARSVELLTLVELPNARELLKRYPHELSGGQRQRVMIAMALSCEPKLLIADEPTTALDVTIQAQILGLLQKLQKQLGMSVLLITHDLGIVAGIADRVQVMYVGQIMERGTTEEIFTAPQHPYTAALLAAIPRRNMERRSALYALPGTPPDLRLELHGCPFAARCRYAMPICIREMPEETDDCRCWLRHPMAPQVALMGGEGNA